MTLFHSYNNPYDIDMYFFLKKFINIEYSDEYKDGYFLINHDDINNLKYLSSIVGNNNKKTKILCMYGWEAYTDFKHLNDFYDNALTFGFDTNKIVIVYNNLYKSNIQKYNVPKFGNIQTLSFPRMLFEKHLINETEFTSIHELRKTAKHNFSCFNRLGRLHKQKTIDYITDIGLDSYNTYKFSDGFDIRSDAKIVQIKENHKEIPNHLEFYNGKVNICVETLYYSDSEYKFDEVVHLTEKIFRNIMLKIPFTLVSNKFALNRFRKLGFKTFDSIIDESYDESDDNVRYKLAVDSAVKLLPHYDSKSVQDVLDYNFNLLIDKVYVKNMFNELFTKPLNNLDN